MSDHHAVTLQPRKRGFLWNIGRYKFLYLLGIPTIILFILFEYLPMYGIIIAFQDYKPHLGIAGMFEKSKWVGLTNFVNFFNSFYFGRLLRNTVRLSLLKLLFNFPAPIILAIFLNEMRNKKFKKVAQTISYLPHFLSWVILAGVVNSIFDSSGTVNYVIKTFGGEKVNFLYDKTNIIWIIVLSSTWQSVGWGSIVYLATLSGIDSQLYESSVLDGATRFQQIIYINLPALYNIVSIRLILSMGSILNAGFGQVLMLYNELTYETVDIIDTFVYRQGILDLKYSYSTAVGLFKTVIGLAMMLSVNYLAKKMGRESLF